MKRFALPAIVLGLTFGVAHSAPLSRDVGNVAQMSLSAQQVEKVGWRRHHGWHGHRWHRRWHRRHHGWWGPRRHYGWWGYRRHHYWR